MAHQFGADSQRQQYYVGPVSSYSASKHWIVHIEPAFGFSDVSDPFMLRMGVGYSIDHLPIGDHRLCERQCGLGSVPADQTRAEPNLKLSLRRSKMKTKTIS